MTYQEKKKLVLEIKLKFFFLKGNLKHKQKKGEKREREINVDKRTLVTKGQQ